MFLLYILVNCFIMLKKQNIKVEPTITKIECSYSSMPPNAKPSTKYV